MVTTRRDFLRQASAAGAAVPLTGTLDAVSAGAGSAAADPVLVLIEARGGWDYLGMLPPVHDPIYKQQRPYLAMPPGKALWLANGGKAWWHPALQPMKTLYDRGDLAIVHNVGHPGADLSHFVTENKWHASDPWARVVHEGWLARYVKRGYKGSFQVPALSVGSRQSKAFFGSDVPSLLVPDSLALSFDYSTPHDTKVERLLLEANALATQALQADPLQREIARRTVQAIRDSDLFNDVGRDYKPRARYPDDRLSRDLQVVARYVTAGLATRVYHVSTSGFDTHSRQGVISAPEQGDLAIKLKTFAEALQGFLDDVNAHGHGQRVVVMAYSEFGRRVNENGSVGTDHGHGGVAFFAGKPVRGGRFGQEPDLAAIHKPGQSYYIPFDARSTDFRSLYGTALERWLGVRHEVVLGQRFPLLGAL